MALTDGELFVSSDGASGPTRQIVKKSQAKQIAATAIVLNALTPMSWNTSTLEWAPWDANGSNGLDVCQGFLKEQVEIDTDSQIANIILAGTVHYEDVLDAVEANGVEVEADLQTELRSQHLRSIGLFVEGLTQVY